jgi:hypothetical protein
LLAENAGQKQEKAFSDRTVVQQSYVSETPVCSLLLLLQVNLYQGFSKTLPLRLKVSPEKKPSSGIPFFYGIAQFVFKIFDPARDLLPDTPYPIFISYHSKTLVLRVNKENHVGALLHKLEIKFGSANCFFKIFHSVTYSLLIRVVLQGSHRIALL